MNATSIRPWEARSHAILSPYHSRNIHTRSVGMTIALRVQARARLRNNQNFKIMDERRDKRWTATGSGRRGFGVVIVLNYMSIQHPVVS